MTDPIYEPRRGGSYVIDPKTGARRPADEVAVEPAPPAEPAAAEATKPSRKDKN